MKRIVRIGCCVLLSIVVSGCIRTSEDIRLDKEMSDLQTKVDMNNEQINAKLDTEIQSIRNSQVDMLSKLGSNGDDIKDLRNRVDILQHRLNNLRQDLDLFTTTGGTLNTSIEQRLSALETSMTAVEAWMSFTSAYGKKTAYHHTETSVRPHPLNLDDAVALFRSKKYTQAKPVFERYAKNGTVQQKTRSVFYLGETAYREKDYKTAIANYGIIVEKYPDSNLITSAYFMIGKSFVKLGDKKKARLFFDELISRYPKDTLSKDAAQELKKLK